MIDSEKKNIKKLPGKIRFFTYPDMLSDIVVEIEFSVVFFVKS